MKNVNWSRWIAVALSVFILVQFVQVSFLAVDRVGDGGSAAGADASRGSLAEEIYSDLWEKVGDTDSLILDASADESVSEDVFIVERNADEEANQSELASEEVLVEAADLSTENENNGVMAGEKDTADEDTLENAIASVEGAKSNDYNGTTEDEASLENVDNSIEGENVISIINMNTRSTEFLSTENLGLENNEETEESAMNAFPITIDTPSTNGALTVEGVLVGNPADKIILWKVQVNSITVGGNPITDLNGVSVTATLTGNHSLEGNPTITGYNGTDLAWDNNHSFKIPNAEGLAAPYTITFRTRASDTISFGSSTNLIVDDNEVSCKIEIDK